MDSAKKRLSQRKLQTSLLETDDRSFALLDLQLKRRERESLDGELQTRKQTLETLQQQADDLEEEIKKANNLELSDITWKERATNQLAERTERECREAAQWQEELERLKVECATLRETKEEMRGQVDKHAVYIEYLERVVKMTKFDSIQAFTDHCESLLHFQDLLYQRETEAQEKVHQQKKALLMLEDKHHILRLQKKHQLFQLQTELEETCSEALKWEREWNHIQETAAKKTLLLGQIKIATLNLFEIIQDKAEEDEDVDINDTEKQLDTVKVFIKDYEDILKKLQTSTQRRSGHKKDKSVVNSSRKKSQKLH